MDKIKVLHVIGGGEVGGAEELVLTQMQLLDKNRYQPFMVCLCAGTFDELVAEKGFQAQVMAMKHRLDLTPVQPLRELIRREGIDIVHTHGVRANLVARKAARLEGIPVVTTVHSVLRFDYDSWLKAAFARLITRLTNHNSDHFIAISGAIRDEIESMGVSPAKISVIYNGLNVSRFTESRPAAELARELGLAEGKKVVSMVARLHPVKGHRYFLEAARQVIDAGMEAQFLIIGEGEQRRKLEALVKQLGLQEQVRMPGYWGKVEDIYAVSDLLCVPSVMEGLGLVVLEAMYFGVPVVASNTGGIPEIITEGKNGLLVEPRDADQLARAIKRILTEPGLAESLVAEGHQTVEDFSQERMARQVEKIYETLKGQGDGPSVPPQ